MRWMVSRTLLAAALAAPGLALAQEEVRAGQAAMLTGGAIEIYNVSGFAPRRGGGVAAPASPCAPPRRAPTAVSCAFSWTAEGTARCSACSIPRPWKIW